METEGLSSSVKKHSLPILSSWILKQVNSGKYPGLVWDDETKTTFRIPWKNAHKRDFRSDKDAAFFTAWADYKGVNSDSAAGAKHRMRCALNHSREFSEVSGRSELVIPEPYRVYRLVPLSEQGTNCDTPEDHQGSMDHLLRTHAIEDILHRAVYKEEDSPGQERSPSLLQEEPEPLHIKEEPEEVLLRPEEPDASMSTLLAVKREDEEEEEKDEEDIFSHCSGVKVKLESDCDVTEDSDWWESGDDDDEQCGKSSNESAYLKAQPIHGDAGGKTFLCKHCNKSFVNLGNLSRHRRIHTGEKPFRCAHCNKSFREAWSLKIHQRVHTGEKPFCCKHCNKSFSLSTTLKTHERIHTGEKPFLCEHCGKSFGDASTLTKHQRVHAGEKTPFSCKHCNMSFSDSSTLERHQLIHTREKPFKCKHCDKSYTDLSALKRHQHVHTGEKPFQCKHCDKTFIQSSDLNRHERVHTGEKPYNCRDCDKSFSESSNLKNHQHLHTGEKNVPVYTTGKELWSSKCLEKTSEHPQQGHPAGGTRSSTH